MNKKQSFRLDADSMGKLKVPTEALYQAQTQAGGE